VRIVDGSLCTLIDEGSSSTYDKASLRPLDENPLLRDVPPLAVKCHLAGVAPPGYDGAKQFAWTEEAVEVFKSVVSSAEHLVVTFHGQGASTAVRLDADNEDVGELLVRKGVGIRAILSEPLAPGVNEVID
jgi:predicted RNA-binding protein YlqC (UPF0109 family)